MLGPRGEDDVEELKLRAVVDGPLLALALHAQLPKKEQMRVFEPTAEGTRLVVVATNVAESSITIPGVRYVVDTGRSRNRVYVSYVFTRMSIVSLIYYLYNSFYISLRTATLKYCRTQVRDRIRRYEHGIKI